MADAPTSRPWLRASPSVLSARYDVLVLDLDGTVYRGASAVPGAPGVIASLRSRGIHPVFVTNNASRTPSQVAAHLATIGVASVDEEVVTSAQAAAAELATMLEPNTAVLVVGGDGLREALRERGLDPVDAADGCRRGGPGMVSRPGVAVARRRRGCAESGVPWVVTNTDLTLPTERGPAPGNGAFVGLLAAVSGRTPDRVAGKPGPALLLQAAARFPGVAPLAVGDRLDTDVRGAVAAGMDCLLVLSGVASVRDLLEAAPDSRPTYVSYDLTGLDHRHPAPTSTAGDRAAGSWACGSSRATVQDGGTITLALPGSSPREALDALRALCAAAWTAADQGVRWSLADDVLARVQPRGHAHRGHARWQR